MQPPNVSLQPGMTGSNVQQLQQYLVENGYMSQADMNTGPGTYGPKTTAAVTKMQQALGVDNSSGPGYYGPMTKAAAQNKSSGSILSTNSSSVTPPLQQGSTNMGGMTLPQVSTAITPTASSAPPPVQSNTSGAPAATSGAPTTFNTPSGDKISTDGKGNFFYSRSGAQIGEGSPMYREAAAAYSASSSGNSSTTNNINTTASNSAPQGIPYDPSWQKYGITADLWNQMSSVQRGTIGAALGAASSMYSASGSSVTLDQALKLAATDPNIISKYADAAKIDAQVFQQNLTNIQTAISSTAQQQQIQFENEKRALADQSAAAGQAYSGYRGLAEKQMSETESGIVTSSRSDLQNKLNQATSAFETRYGTTATPSATATYMNPLTNTPESLSGAPAGGITGSVSASKAQDINALAGQYVTLGQTPNVIKP